jgi:hypothetical protein
VHCPWHVKPKKKWSIVVWRYFLFELLVRHPKKVPRLPGV